MLKLIDHISERIIIFVKIPQGFFLSSILYVFYNAEIIERCIDFALDMSVSDFIDDIDIVAVGESTEINLITLIIAHQKCEK